MKDSTHLLVLDALRESLGSACLYDLPWVNQSNRDENAVFSMFEKKAGSGLEELVRLEHLDKVPRGHDSAAWAQRVGKHGGWWRPHRIDEVFVEAFFPWWEEVVGCRPPYVAVISSGPYGGIETVYVNGRGIYQLPPDIHCGLFEKWKSDLHAREPRALNFELASECYGAVGVSSSANTRRILSET